MKKRCQNYYFCIYLLLTLGTLNAQQAKNDSDYGFQINDMSIPATAPDGYESVKTVSLSQPLYPDKAYEVGFWIFGKQLPDRNYAFPIQVFPSNFMGYINEEIFDLVESQDIMPTLKVDRPPSYTSKGYYTFVIRPDIVYEQLTVALKVSRWDTPPINIRDDITVTGIFIKILPDTQEKESITASDEQRKPKSDQEKDVSETKAERKLLDSKKSYSVTENEISIGLYDHRNIDRDRVTIYLNNRMVVENYELKRTKKFFKAQLKRGKNTITLHAENLGNVSPNTAAIIIKSKSKEFMAVLESDLGTSEYFTLVYEPEN